MPVCRMVALPTTSLRSWIAWFLWVLWIVWASLQVPVGSTVPLALQLQAPSEPGTKAALPS